ncbi:MAG: kynureninase [Candidatus Kapabacteria bacterium]|nr:kynureninase [Candidatus Kapabacteria bacterium]MDW8011732.1 kynureninase [Bacteroidota bacterium]
MRSEYEATEEYARHLDDSDPIAEFRRRFFIPCRDGKELVYFCGNSLGLLPKEAEVAVHEELRRWAELAVDGHFHGPLPWFSYHRTVTEYLAELVGAQPHEVVAMNSLSVNLHLLLASFYRPAGRRTKILMEHYPFPSDLYVAQTHLRWHGLEPSQHIVLVEPPLDGHLSRTEDICSRIAEFGEELALVFLSGVHYYTGQRFEIEPIVQAAHAVGAHVILDLAHAIGNVELQLHAWGVDAAAWCSYKYLNSGPGGVGGIFVHERHATDRSRVRLGGWWGTPEETRFRLLPEFLPTLGAEGWQLSNAPVLPLAVHRIALRLFHEAGFELLCAKRDWLSSYAEYWIETVRQAVPKAPLRLLTPSDLRHRGCQLSLWVGENGQELYNRLQAAGIVVDWREPNVIRLAPVPLYNSFRDVYIFGRTLLEAARALWG